MTITPERRDELTAMVTPTAVYDVLSRKPIERADQIATFALVTLDLLPVKGIEALPEHQRNEVLFVMRSLRDAVYPNPVDGSPW